jgi:two-component system LytT family sensor kinase
MQTSRKLYWGAQLLGWTGYSCLIYLSAYVDRPNEITYKLLVQLLFMTVFSISYTHLMRWFMLKMNWLNKKLVALLPRLIVISISCAVLIEYTLSSAEYFLLKDTEAYNNLGRVIINILALTLLVVCWNGIYFTYHFFEKSRQQELDNLSLEASKNEIELKNLRSQLNPHFLFNSLNSIRALIDIEPNHAKSAITTLSVLLRKSLISGKENLIPLTEEIEIVSNYLELEKIRFEERLTIIWELDEQLNSFPIPPFSIQMLAENAVKHGISKQIDGGIIKIRTYQKDNAVIITLENTGKLGKSTDTGIGISNTKRRLDIQYKGKADFTLKELENSVLATLKFEHENH